MSKTVNILFVVMFLVFIFCSLYETFYYKRRMYEREGKSYIRTIEHSKGEMTYLIFISPDGTMHAVNYSLDSMDYEAHKRFDK